MTRKESNRLILDFMGVKPLITGNIHSWSDAPHYYTTEDTFEKVMDNISNYAKYDTSWDWLMDVVEKIESLGYWTDIFGGAQNLCFIGRIKNTQPFVFEGNLANLSKIKSTYKACVKFIESYNNSQFANQK